MQWEIRQGADVSMPFEEEDVVGLLELSELPADTLVRPVGKTAWKPVTKHGPFAMAIRRASPPAPSGYDTIPSTPDPPPRDPARWDQQTSLNLPVPASALRHAPPPAAQEVLVATSATQPRAAAPVSPPFAGGLPTSWAKAGVIGVWALFVGLAVVTGLTWRRADQSEQALRTLVDASSTQLRRGQEEALADTRAYREYRKATLDDVTNICHAYNDRASCTITNTTNAPVTVCFAAKVAQKEALGVTLLSMQGCTGRLDPSETRSVDVPWVQGRAEDICNSKSAYGRTHLDWDKCTFVAR